MNMIERSKQRKFLQIFVVALTALFCLFSFFVFPIHVSNAERDDLCYDFDAFKSSLLQMLDDNRQFEQEKEIVLTENDYKIEDDEIFIKKSALNELKEVANTFSAETFLTVDDFSNENDVEVCVENEQIVLRKSPEINRLIVCANKSLKSCDASAKAEYGTYHIFQYENAEQASLAYDYYNGLDGVTVCYDFVTTTEGEVVETNSTYTYNSWGAKYVGYNEYVNTLLENCAESDLPNVVVAVLDSGLYANHELFTNRILVDNGKNFTTEQPNVGDDVFMDYNGHGTHVSGTIVESTLSNVKILPMKVLDSEGEGYGSMIVAALNEVINLKKNGLNIKVVNMSLGIKTSSSVNANKVQAMESTIAQAVKSAYSAGVTSVVSAGNDKSPTNNAVPANVDCAITVSAVRRVTYYNYGEKLLFDYSYSNYGAHVDFAAPGTGICSAGISASNAYVTMKGTSMAAPHVTAAVALVYSHPSYKDASQETMYSLLKEKASRQDLVTTDISTSQYGQYASNPNANGWDQYYGYGLINVADVGIENAGEIMFSETNQFQSSSFNLKLSYSEELATSQILKIYYTTDENATSVLTSSSNLYSDSTGITISNKTTKVTAAAFVYNADGLLTKRSKVSSIIYYFKNRDLACNYEFEVYSSGYSLKKYKGELKTLEVPTSYKGYSIIAISAYAFNDSQIETLYLPSSINEFRDYAFYNKSNSTLKAVYCSSSSVKVGNYAFRYSNLSVLKIPNITEIQDYAFANCSNLKTLELPNVTTIGTHAFSNSTIETLFVGKKLTYLGTQKNVVVGKVYGYVDTPIYEFAVADNSFNFYDLTLRVKNEYLCNVVSKKSDTISLEFDIVGYGITYTPKFKNIVSANYDLNEETVDNYSKKLKIEISGLIVGGNYSLNVDFKDAYGTTYSTDTVKITIVSDSTETFAISFNQGNFDVYVDDFMINSTDTRLKNADYSFKIVPKAGYLLNSIFINGTEYATNVNKILLKNVSNDVEIEVSTSEQESLVITFDSDSDKGSIIVSDSIVGDSQNVDRNNSLTFSIAPKMGYCVKSVTVNDEILTADENGFYHINNIVENAVVCVVYKEAFYNINVSLGKGGNISVTGGTLTSVAHGSSRVFHISTNNGYAIDFVSVNGKEIALENNTFEIENIDGDNDVVVSFKKEQSSIFSGENSSIFYYFLIFLGMFVVFVFARIVLHFVNKNNSTK